MKPCDPLLIFFKGQRCSNNSKDNFQIGEKNSLIITTKTRRKNIAGFLVISTEKIPKQKTRKFQERIN